MVGDNISTSCEKINDYYDDDNNNNKKEEIATLFCWLASNLM